MTPIVEAVVLPALFLTVMLIAALRPGEDLAFIPPSLAAMVAAGTLVALLVRSGALAPERLLHPGRTLLANGNGLALLIVAFAAAAQLITALVPAAGLPALLAWTVLVSLLAQAWAIGPDRTRLLRGLLVTFTAAFILKFVVLAAISAPATSGVGRALQLLFEGVTLGTVAQPAAHPAEGYLAFIAIALFLTGIALLPRAGWQMVRVGMKELSP